MAYQQHVIKFECRVTSTLSAMTHCVPEARKSNRKRDFDLSTHETDRDRETDTRTDINA